MSNYEDEQEMGGDLYNRAAGSAGAGITREVKTGPRPIGLQRPIADPRLVKHDRLTARAAGQVSWEVSKDDRMSAEAAGAMMQKLIERYRMVGETPGNLEAFHNAIYFAHTLNGSSVLQPGRATFSIAGFDMDYKHAVDLLGNDLRRFYRAYADEVRACNKRILAEASNGSDIVAQEKAALLRQVAAKKNLSRYPELAHDTADACWNLSDSELAALMASKAAIFSTTSNMADRNRPRAGQSADVASGNMHIAGPGAYD